LQTFQDEINFWRCSLEASYGIVAFHWNDTLALHWMERSVERVADRDRQEGEKNPRVQ